MSRKALYNCSPFLWRCQERREGWTEDGRAGREQQRLTIHHHEPGLPARGLPEADGPHLLQRPEQPRHLAVSSAQGATERESPWRWAQTLLSLKFWHSDINDLRLQRNIHHSYKQQMLNQHYFLRYAFIGDWFWYNLQLILIVNVHVKEEKPTIKTQMLDAWKVFPMPAVL